MGRVEIVPFGKYKGQPVEALAQDRKYCDWLMGQEWFRSSHTAIHTLIVNNFGVPDETPEHNALQALFTNEEWAKRFATLAMGGNQTFEENRLFHLQHNRLTAAEVERAQSATPAVRILRIAFEVAGADIQFEARRSHFDYWDVRVECKPVLGDEYPAVLRQMRASRCNVLLIGEGGYTGTGATLEQVTAMFRTAGIRIVHLHEV